jgi:predicted nuclease of restriction endonuclease-like (RecB) superfamily
MSKSITIFDNDYQQWVKTLIERYRETLVRASVKVNSEQLMYNFLLGRDIVEMHVEERWGEGVIPQLSKDLKREMPTVEGLSVTNLRYCRRFYLLYCKLVTIRPQLGGELTVDADNAIRPQAEGELSTHILPQEIKAIFRVPWGHHKLILDKVKGDVNKALFYINQTIENGWSRSLLLNWIDTGMYERAGKSLTNFSVTIPNPSSDLAQELTKDPYNFAFAGVTKRHNEAELKLALLKNITDFLVELGTGFAYVGREYRLQVGHTENFIDLLFYNLKLRCYVVVEVKIGKFSPADIGQIGSYIVAVNHQLREEGKDNPTIGLLICRSKDNTQAQYALESSSQPIGISEYELEKFYPGKVEGTIPTIEEIEAKLSEMNLEQ